MIDAKPRKAVRLATEERIAAGLCLHCDEAASRRGLCTKHYGRFRIAYNSKPDSQKLIFEAEQIRKGNILKSRQGKPGDTVNEFLE